MTLIVKTPNDDGSTLDDSFLQWYRSLPRSCFEVPSCDDLDDDEKGITINDTLGGPQEGGDA